MTIAINTRTFVGISDLKIQRQSDGVVYSWPQPETFVLSTNVEQRVQTGRDTQGKMVRLNSYVAGEMPQLSIQYQYLQPEMVAFQIGKQLATGTFDTFIPRSLAVLKAEYSAAAVGFLYNGVLAADAELAGVLAGATASVTRDGVSTALDRQPYATFDPAEADSFAVGDDGALKFSTNLVTAQELVTMLIPASVAGARLSEVFVGPLRVFATLVDTRNRVTLFEAFNASADLEGRSIDFNSGSVEVSLLLNNLPGTCGSWSIIDLSGTQVACA
jgi:hypothetical protein